MATGTRSTRRRHRIEQFADYTFIAGPVAGAGNCLFTAYAINAPT